MPSTTLHVLSIVLASASVVTGLQFGLPNGDLVKGQIFNFTYLPADGMSGPISLVRWLGTGFGPIATLNVTAGDGKFAWTPWDFLTPATDYAFAVAPGSEIVYSNTFVIRNAAALSPASEPSSVSPAIPIPASTAALDRVPNGRHQKLNTGKKIGIGFGVASAVLLLALGAYLLGRSSRRRSKGASTDTESSINKEYKPELKETPVRDVAIPKGMGAGGSVQELQTDGVVAELEGQAVLCKSHEPHELPGHSERAEIDPKTVAQWTSGPRYIGACMCSCRPMPRMLSDCDESTHVPTGNV